MNIFRALEIPGWMQPSELEWLGNMASNKKLIVEVGSYLGRSTRALADNTEGKVIALDNWFGPKDIDKGPDGLAIEREKLYDDFTINLKDLIDKGKVRAIKTDYEKLELTIGINSLKPDMVFIDGDHTFEAVTRDIQFWKPKIVPGGLLCGHDYNHPPVTQAVERLLTNVKFASRTAIWFTEV